MTTVAVLKTKFGTFIGADTQVTSNNFKIPAKISKILNVENLLIGISGGVGITQNSVKKIKNIINQIKKDTQRDIILDAKSVSEILAEDLFNCLLKNIENDSTFLVCDNKKIFLVDAGGGLMEVKEYFSIGSGDQLAMGVLNKDYTKDLNEHAAFKLITSALKSAHKGDIYTNGVFEIFKVGNDSKIKKLKKK